MALPADFFRTFCHISKAFGTTLSTEKLLLLIVEKAVQSLRAKAACLFLADENRDIFVPKAQVGLSDNYLHANPLSARSIVKAVLAGGHLVIADATSDPRVEHHEVKKSEGVASILDVPVVVHDKVIGILALYSGNPREFSSDEIDFLKALAEQGGIALDHARLVERINCNARIFLELSQEIGSTLDIRAILECLAGGTCGKLGLKAAAIQLQDGRNGRLETATAYGLSVEFQAQVPELLQRCSQAAMEGRTVSVADIGEDPLVKPPEPFQKEGLGALLSVPIKSRQEIIGVLHLFSAVPRKFPSDLQMIVSALAHTGALAIRNAALYLQLQKDKQNLEEDMWAHRSWFCSAPAPESRRSRKPMNS